MADADRHLLFGLIALQVGLVDQGQLVAAFQAWSLDGARGLDDHLVDRGALDHEGRAAVGAMVALHLRKHGDPERSLAAIPASRSTREDLARLVGPEVRASLARAGSRSTAAGGPDRTLTYVPGADASEGRRFRILRPHARGGLGEVFVALDEELHREVALKQILDRHADDPESRTRFVLEAEITGGLEHPGIVPVYGLGHGGGGRPFYAMRFVRGDSLKGAIAAFHADPTLAADPGRRSLALRELLRRFVDVCNAVDYAHTRGVVHRDLKPANIILGKHGETLVVDWGLAKATGKSGAGAAQDERTLVPSPAGGSVETLSGAVLGTPAYMSPEQASGDPDRLGPRSDVYSLGATLYCLLTGSPPRQGEDLGAVLRAVSAGDIPPPRTVAPGIDRALEAVCLRAIAADPADRYPSARALADDVERWAADEPVSAWREPPARRARRWARRNRAAMAALAVAALATLLGTAAVLAVQSAANVRLRRVNADLEVANDRERQRFDLAVEAIRRYHTGVSEDFLLEQAEFQDLRDRLLRDAIAFYSKLEGLLSEPADRRSRRSLGRAYAEVAELTDKVGSIPEALAAHRRALAVLRPLTREPDPDPSASLDVGRGLIAIGILLGRTGRYDEARAAFAEARAALAEAGPDPGSARGEVARSIYWEGLIHHRSGRPREAMAAYREARRIAGALAASRRDLISARRLLSWCDNDIGQALHEAGASREALDALEDSRRIKQEIVADHPGNPEYRRDLSISHGNLGLALRQANEPEAALVAFGQERQILEGLVRAYPAVTIFQTQLANSLNEGGDTLRALGRPAEARALYERAIAICDRLVEANPDLHHDRTWLLQGLRGLGAAERDLGRPAPAAAAWRRAIDIGDGLRSHAGETLYYLASCRALLGGIAGTPGSGLSPERGAAERGLAMATLRRAVAAGYRGADWFRRDPDLASLQGRPDFRLLILDLTFPTDPFAR